MGDEVIVVTTHESVPQEFHGAKLIGSWRNGEPEKPLIFYVGRLGVEKSLDFLKRVMDRLPGARMAFIGDGPFRAELEQMFSGMPAVFTGTLQGEELSQAYASGDVFVMPSESETLGFVVLEAMSSGVPVVGARAGGIPDIIPEDQEGRPAFCTHQGVDNCAGKIEQLLSSEELREDMGGLPGRRRRSLTGEQRRGRSGTSSTVLLSGSGARRGHSCCDPSSGCCGC
ncbi:unnamed protein product [Miscanthus lutarioriparius]|uniref:Glycosyl transferase family 1 domain-containing protein n=1 Tax=Miscanthus lutarioriparius TaxID=422564 RepID=A0A811NDK2_9POAL|nr:unnamed protein product [Miscanthus lutarioriparius]